jgi:hypothetical protein
LYSTSRGIIYQMCQHAWSICGVCPAIRRFRGTFLITRSIELRSRFRVSFGGTWRASSPTTRNRCICPRTPVVAHSATGETAPSRKRVPLLDAQKLGVGTTIFVMLCAPEYADKWFESFHGYGPLHMQTKPGYGQGKLNGVFFLHERTSASGRPIPPYYSACSSAESRPRDLDALTPSPVQRHATPGRPTHLSANVSPNVCPRHGRCGRLRPWPW